ncbi:mitochondrial fission ELM1 family protein [Kushneria phosphatilytica]|uniref:mitochondrial fission ELM1 family protein n=1 Tax=Kushneria phosphatilytica TaxID=657387 RepID=UPI00143AA96F|nr:ELM1/GtrOC1 family putative glycosyltransferase [Kushneria phosphatilytica]
MTRLPTSSIASRPIHVERATTPHMPHCVVLPVLEPVGERRPPVHIYVGSETAQVRAQRIFLFSIEKVRDPQREYRIYLLKNMAGFDRHHWRTGFTNYRYAIPTLAEGQGRAIYNDVGQIYLEDPARLFDLPMGGHGYLALSPEETSVMLLDCERMAHYWNQDTARRYSKQNLLHHVEHITGLWAPLDASWNTRDEEYADQTPRLLHFTALHQQPWQPMPDRYSYQPHPLADIWFGLEREADVQGYGPFSAATPSPWFEGALSTLQALSSAAFSPGRTARDTAEYLSLQALLWCRPAQHADNPPLPAACYRTCTPAELISELQTSPADELTPLDSVAVTHLLEHLPAEDIPWVLEQLAQRSRRLLYVGLELSTNVHQGLPLSMTHWWRQQLRRLNRHHPHLSWHLDIRRGSRRKMEVVSSTLPGARLSDVPEHTQPSVWVLTGVHRGDNAQLRLLADWLGWPWEEKPLVFRARSMRLLQGARPTLQILHPGNRNQFAPPWPDIVLGIGRRSVNVARWIRRESGQRTQLFWLGRPRVALDHFDLIATTPQYGLPARDHIIHNLLPLNRPNHDDAAREAWRQHLSALPRPWLGVMIGGATRAKPFPVEDAVRMARQACALARDRGGSLLVSTSPRTPPDVTTAFFEQIDVPAFTYDWQTHQGGDNPHQAYLALCDGFIVSDDSASMMAEAITTRQPTWIYALESVSPSFTNRLFNALHDWLCRRTRQLNHRGVHRQQNWQGRFHDFLFTRGLLVRPRDLNLLDRTLRIRGLIQPLADGPASDPEARRSIPMNDELEATVEEMRLRAGERYRQE